MKEERPSFAFSKGEIKAFRAISSHNGSSIKQLSSILGKSESSVSQSVKELEKKGTIKTKMRGMSKSVDISDRNYAYSLMDMIRAEPFVPWEDLISNSNTSVLLKDITGEDSYVCGLSPVSVWRSERNLSMHGMRLDLGNMEGNSNRRLKHFIKEYSEHVSRNYLAEILPKDAAVLWSSGFRCLFKIKSDLRKERKVIPNNTLPTALSVAPSYGMQLMTTDSYFYHEPGLNEMTIEDAILHIMLISPGSQTYASYTLLLTYKAGDRVNLQDLMKKAIRYGLEEEVQKIVNYVKSNGRKREWPLPKLVELKEQADLYGIVIT